MTSNGHSFGGTWTNDKLTIINKYIKFYSTALKGMPFKLHYVDPFSGSGAVDFEGELIECDPIEGSAARALSIEPPFTKYHFNEPNKKRREQLVQLAKSYPDRNVDIMSDDANEMIRKVCNQLGFSDRAVFFIDPYGCQLDWKSLETIAQGKGNDVWLWFPVNAVMRQATLDRNRIQPAWRERLNKLFGTNEWEKALYESPEAQLGITDDLFGAPAPQQTKRAPGNEALDRFVMQRLEEIFPYVNQKPMAFYNQKNSMLFQLYFAMSNNNSKAKKLAEKVVNHILRTV